MLTDIRELVLAGYVVELLISVVVVKLLVTAVTVPEMNDEL